MSGPTQQFGVPDFDGIRRGDNNSLADAMILMWRVLTVNNPQLVTLQNTQTLSNKTLVTPTVSDLTNMTHDHADAAGGGNTLTVPTIADLTNMTHDHSSAAEGGAIAAGSVDHGGLGGLSDDDHTQYLLADGTRALAGSWSLGENNLTSVALMDGVDIEKINSFFNGTFQETFDALVTSDGATVTMSLEQSGTGDLVMQFSDGYTTLDCTPAQTIALTAGTDASPQANYVYVLQSSKALTVSTSAWPSAEHIRVGYFLVPSAGFVQTNGCYINQNWNDHLAGTDNQGHMAHMAAKSRALGSSYFSGVGGNGASDYFTLSASNTEFASTEGSIFQMHPQTFSAVDTATGDVLLVKNWSGDSYHDITDLFEITADSTGTTITNNRYFNLTFWGVANKGGEYATVIVNLPGGFYATQADAENDVDGYDDYVIPREFTIDSSTGFLICRATFQLKSTWVHVSTVDLRGKTPETAGGAGVNDHGGLGGLGDDDHSQYYLADATRKMALLFMGELSADPSDPAEGEAVMWMSDGTGSGSDGDILMKITAGAATSTVELVVAPA